MTRIHHDSPKKNWFINCVLADNTVKATGEQFNILQSTASDIWHKIQQTGLTHKCPQSGCLAKITSCTTCAVIHEPRSTTASISLQLAKWSHPPSLHLLFGKFSQMKDSIVGKHATWCFSLKFTSERGRLEQ